MSAPEPLVERITVGRWTVHLLQAGGVRLDGGAMFGVVPKTMWARRIPADELNRIPMCMRCVLIEHESGLILLDSGAGNKESQKFLEIYGIENGGPGGRSMLEAAFAAAGHRPEDVKLVINTHLHFDHAGGNTYRDDAGAVKPTFPNARYVVQRGEHHWATHTNERTGASYFLPNFEPAREAGLFDFVEGEQEIVAGVRVIPTPGHVPFHQGILLSSNGEQAFYLADLAPTASHLPLPWIMGYDVEPLVTLETKRRIFKRALDEGWRLLFEHDAFVSNGRLAHDGKTYTLAPEVP